MSKQRPGVMVYFELLDETSELSTEECGMLFRDMLVYAQYGVLPTYSDRTMRTIWNVVKGRIDSDATRYELIAAKRSEAGKKGGRPPRITSADKKQLETKKPNAFLEKQKKPTTPTPTPTPTTTTTPTTTPTTNITPYSSCPPADKPQTKTKFSKPSVDDIAAYCQERNNGVDAQRFFDYYEANGWKVGKNPMKDWKAAVRTWERNEKSGSNAAKPINNPDKYQYGKEYAL